MKIYIVCTAARPHGAPRRCEADPHACGVARAFTMVNCAVYGCSNHSKNGRNDKNVRQIGFLSIPKLKLNECPKTAELSLKRGALWLQRIHRADLDVTANHYRICGDHFLTGERSVVELFSGQV